MVVETGHVNKCKQTPELNKPLWPPSRDPLQEPTHPLLFKSHCCSKATTLQLPKNHHPSPSCIPFSHHSLPPFSKPNHPPPPRPLNSPSPTPAGRYFSK